MGKASWKSRKTRRKERRKRSWADKARAARRAQAQLLPQDRIALPTDVLWHVLYLRVNWTDRVEKDLARAGFATYFPFLLEARATKGQAEPLEHRRALFPRYLFVGLDPVTLRYQAVEQIDGVHGFIRDQGRPATVDVTVLQALSDRVTSLVELERPAPQFFLPPGSLVRVTDGPFASFDGVVEELLSDGRLKVLVDIFGRQTPIETDLASLEAA